MNSFPTNIKDFLIENKLASVCFINEENNPHCINCFYCFDDVNQLLIFKSASNSEHLKFVLYHKNVAGTVLPDSQGLLKLSGLQFSGIILEEEQIISLNLASTYLKTHPLSIAKSGDIWAVRLNFIKFIDSAFGLGKSSIWKRNNF
jgi:uncharacterized protein YhbP (UPF0306 family)